MKTDATISNIYQISGAISITHPSDISFENGTFGKYINWNATTDIPKNYTVTRNDTIIDSSSAWNGEIIDIPVDWIYRDNLVEVLPALFIFKCIVFDMDNDSISDIVEVSVIPDTTAPIIESPADFEYEVGSVGNYIRWNITETNPDFFNITRRSNETGGYNPFIDSGDWDGQNFTINVDHLNESRWYEYTLFVNDTLGHSSTASVNITVYPDLTPPVIDSPDDISFEFGSSPHSLVWHTYDSNPKNYSIEVIVLYINNTYGNTTERTGPPDNSTQDWEVNNPDGVDITFGLDNLYLGNYTYRLTLFDVNGLNASDAVNISIYKDLRPPIIASPGNLEYEEGYTGYEFVWSAEESNPEFYNLTFDGVVVQEGRWNGENISLNADGYLPATYEVTLNLFDYFDQNSSDTVYLEVTPDSQLPFVSSISLIESFVSADRNTLSAQLYATDLNGIFNASVEWYTSANDTHLDESMTQQDGHLYSAALGEFLLGSVVHYRVIVVDNSSVHNVFTSDWIEYDVSTMLPEPTPGILVAIFLLLGGLSLLVILSLYFRTRTR